MPYRIVITKSAVKELDGLSAKIHEKIIDHLHQLEENPRIFGAEKLTAIKTPKRACTKPFKLRSEIKSHLRPTCQTPGFADTIDVND